MINRKNTAIWYVFEEGKKQNKARIAWVENLHPQILQQMRIRRLLDQFRGKYFK